MTQSVDFAVIGAGIAGASAAYELSRHGSVAVFEMEATSGYHSTGRSAALYTECYGLPVIRRLAAAGREFLASPPDGFADASLVGPRPVMFIGASGQESSVSAGVEEARNLGSEVVELTGEEAGTYCPALRPGHVTCGFIEPGAMDIDVHGVHQGFLRGMRARGGQLITSSPVTGLSPNGERWQVTSAKETVLAEFVVNSAGAWCDQVAALAGIAPIGLTPLRRTAFTFPAPEGATGWPFVVDADEQFYFKPEGPLILASPADETPTPPTDAKPEEIDVALAIERINTATTLDIRHVTHTWAGLRSFVPDKVPVAGVEPDHPGFFWLAGQGGFGIKTSPALGVATAGLIVDGALPSDLRDRGITAEDLSPTRLR